jgi:hypothetical protein
MKLSSLIIALLALSSTVFAQETGVRRFDFGGANVEKGYVGVGADEYSAARGFGWLNPKELLIRERGGPDALRRDFVFSKAPQTFRIGRLKPGIYLVKVVAGDTDYGDHVAQVKIAGQNLPLLNPAQGEFVTLSFTVNVAADALDILFDSPNQNWVVNAVSLEPANAMSAPKIERETVAIAVKNTWPNIAEYPDPTKELLQKFNPVAPANWKPTGLTRADYLKLIAGNVDFWKTQQNADGAIIDPYLKTEWQYSTPAYAHAAALLVTQANRKDLVESAAKALDWSTKTLSQRKAATAHEDFFAPLIAHAIPLLKPHVSAERVARWESDIRGFDPFKTYRGSPNGNNWNVVALAGEALFQKMGLRDKNSKFVEASLAGQGHHFASPYGLYLEGPMAYDAFPRLWMCDLIAHGYDGPFSAELNELMRRGALTSLFMQSPWGELPAGHRSAHHQWNEAEQCVIFEVFAARALKNGDAKLAAMYKRAAHLALSSMFRWQRPSGELQIIKNWVDPAKFHAYEGYSGHSQYNLLAMAMLAIAHHHAEATEAVAEQPAPADVGGFVVELRELHKVFANAGGTYVEIETSADGGYDATGLIRIHHRGLSPQLGLSDSIVSKPKYRVPAGPSLPNTGVGVAWQQNGIWRRVGELDAKNITKWSVENVSATPNRVSCSVVYEGNLFGATKIIENYVLTPGRVELTTEVQGYNGPLRYGWPVLADDGRTPSEISVNANTVTVSQDGGKTAQTFTAPGAASVRVEPEKYANHNGWARLGVAEFPQGGKITLVIAPQKKN